MVEKLEVIADKLTVREGGVLAVIHPRIAQFIHEGICLATIGTPAIAGPEVIAKPYEGKYMIVDRPDEGSLTPVSTDDSGDTTGKYPNRLVGEMVYGYFGEIGYVDLIQQRGSPRLVGIVHVPRRLVHLIGALKGDDGLETFYNGFCKETEGDRWKGYRWNLQAHQTEFSKDALRVLPIEDEQYYWKIERAESDVFKDRRPLLEQISDYEKTVRTFIERLDNHVWRMRPGASLEDSITQEIAGDRFASIQKGTVNLLLL